MSNTKTVMSQAANTLAKPLEVEDVFSTYLYTGTGAAQTITNGIDLDGEGGLVWIKNRGAGGYPNVLFDSERGVTNYLRSETTGAENSAGTYTDMLTSFNSEGFSLGSDATTWVNNTGSDLASWTFRKAPKFFDVVTWTGDGVLGRDIAHNLGCAVGTIFVKRLDLAREWVVYHRSLGATKFLQLNTADAELSQVNRWNDTEPTDAVFTVGNNAATNTSGATYVAYLFAHNDGDGGFNGGDIIKCGSFDGASNTEVDLGFEPQWILWKSSNGPYNWGIVDNMRGIPSGGNDAQLLPNGSEAETANENVFDLNPTGFTWKPDASGNTYIYIAIRRGTKVPESGTEVFDVQFNGGNDPSKAPVYQSGFVTDMAIVGYRTGGSVNYPYTGNRLMGIQTLETHNTDAEESGGTSFQWDFMNGFIDGVPSVITDTQIAWMWKRAPNYFDVVAYTGTSSTSTFKHSLGVKPEMIWVKGRNVGTYGWYVYHKDVTANDQLYLHNANAAGGGFMANTEPTEEVFTLGNTTGANNSSYNYIAYLFATLPGVSKVGSFTGTGSAFNVDCGFTAGARFVLIKKTSGTGDWGVFDTVRGITDSSSPLLRLNNTTAEANFDYLDPYSGGFAHSGANLTFNAVGAEYIFYAIA